jgi:Zn-dependent protease
MEGTVATRASYLAPHEHKEPSNPHAIEGRGFRIGQVAGVGLFIHWSVLAIFALICFSLGGRVFPSWHPDWTPLLTWTTAVAASLVFLASLLAHELSHALVARTQGIPIRRITLFLLGGMAHMESEPESPKAEFLMAIAGPLASIAIGVASLVIGVSLAGIGAELDAAQNPVATVRAIGPVSTLLLWLGPINIAIAVFNLVPGFPLDGGRVLRAALWAATGDLLRASRWASKAGQVVAWSLMLFGVMMALSGALLQGMWMLLIGSFLDSAARSSYQRVLLGHALDSVPVGRVMRRQVDWVGPHMAVDAFIRQHLFVSDQRAFPVFARHDLVGLVSFQDVRRIPQALWPSTTISEIMTPRDRLVTLPPSASAVNALELLGRHDINQIPVIEEGHVVGLVQRGDLLTWLALHEEPAHRGRSSLTTNWE